MKDRVALYPGRVKLTPVAGQSNVYDMVRADQPTQEGTPLNKASLLTDETAALYGLGGSAMPDDVFGSLASHASRHAAGGSDPLTASAIGAVAVNGSGTMSGNLNISKASPAIALNDTTVGNKAQIFAGNNRVYMQVANAEDGDNNRRQLILVNADAQVQKKAVVLNDVVDGVSSVSLILHTGNYSDYAVNKSGDTMRGDLYFKSSENGMGRICKSHNDANDYGTFVRDYGKAGNFVSLAIRANDNKMSFVDADGVTNTILHSGNLDALGVARIETGSYKGTGTYGEENPTIINTGFTPKAILFAPPNSLSLHGAYEYAFRDEIPVLLVAGQTSVELSGVYDLNVEWGTTSISFWCDSSAYGQYNTSGTTYRYVVFG